MPDREKIPREWMRRGEDDLLAAKLAFQAGAPSSPITTLVQQACEKYLKGYLISLGWRLKKIHDLRELVDTAVEYDASFSDFMDLAHKLTAFYLEYRYPSIEYVDFRKEEILEMLEQAEKLIVKIKETTK